VGRNHGAGGDARVLLVKRIERECVARRHAGDSVELHSIVVKLVAILVGHRSARDLENLN